MGILEKINRFPPFLVRAVARKNRGRDYMTLADIAEKSGLPVKTIQRISKKARWDDIPLAVADKFALACGVDLLRIRRHVEFMKRRRKVHMEKNPTFYTHLMSQGVRALRKSAASRSEVAG